MADDEPQQPRGGQDSLFIKIPEQRNILEDVEGMTQIVRNMRESLEVLNEVEKVKRKSVDVFVENVERLNQQLDDVDQRLPEVTDIELHLDRGTPIDVDAGDDEVIDESVQDLRDELEGLRDEMGRLD